MKILHSWLNEFADFGADVEAIPTVFEEIFTFPMVTLDAVNVDSVAKVVQPFTDQLLKDL